MHIEVLLPEKTFKRLQELAVPFEDTPASVVERLLDFHDEHQRLLPRQQSESSEASTAGQDNLDPSRPPDLAHTRIQRATFADKTARNWNELVRVSHEEAVGSAGGPKALCRLSKSNATPGRQSDKGFHYLASIDVSVQNVDANMAWKNALHLAQTSQVSIQVQFEWRDKEAAAYPGQAGVLEWSPELNEDDHSETTN